MKILKSICNFSTNFFGGREIVQGGGEILPKFRWEFPDFKILQKTITLTSTFYKNRNTSWIPIDANYAINMLLSMDNKILA